MSNDKMPKISVVDLVAKAYILSYDKVSVGETSLSYDGFAYDSLEKAKNVKEDLKGRMDQELYIYKVNFNFPNNDNHIGSKKLKVIALILSEDTESMVLLKNGTVGKIIKGKAEIGKKVTVKLNDENGNPITKSGIIEDILE